MFEQGIGNLESFRGLKIYDCLKNSKEVKIIGLKEKVVIDEILWICVVQNGFCVFFEEW